jgi:DNA-binding XRE family transcriptional regulator
MLQRHVAEMIGVTPQTVMLWETHTHAPTKPWMIAGIVKFLGYNPLPPPVTRGEVIRHIRLIRGINFEEAAVEIGVSSTALLAWERNEGRPEDRRCRGKIQAWLNANASYVPLKPPVE